MASSQPLSEKAKGKRPEITEYLSSAETVLPSSSSSLAPVHISDTTKEERPVGDDGLPEEEFKFGLEILHEPAQTVAHPIQIIFVHGLGGSKRGTWKHSKTTFWPIWLRDEKGLENVRIATFGYNSSSNVLKPNTNLSIPIFADQLLDAMEGVRTRHGSAKTIFVAHSLGGLVVKQVQLGKSNPHFAPNHRDLTAIVFLGTPHQGADLAGILGLILDASFSSRKFVRQLKPESDTLKSINNSFNHRANSLKLVSYYETENTRLHPLFPCGRMIVPESSARLEYPAFTLGLDGNHLTIAKYSSTKDSNYTRIASKLSNLVESVTKEAEALALIPSAPQRANIFMVPYDRNPCFTGRDELLDDLQQMLLETQLKKYNHRVAIYGMGGVGKTQIAIEYAYRYKKDYNDIYWIRATDQAALLSGFQELARITRCLPSGADNSKPHEVAKAVLSWLRLQKNWLVVIDNLDDISIAAEFLPAIDTGGHTLITTRNQHSSTIPAEGLEVSVLKEGDAVGLLLSRAGIDEAGFSSHRNTAIEIVKELGYLPLAIDFAAAFIKSLKSIDQFLPLYQNSRKRILAIKSPNELLYPHAVSTTFLLSFEKFKTMDYGDEAAKLLRLFAFLNPDGILIDFLRSGSNGLSDQLREILQDDFAFYQALALLRQFSLIGRPKRDIIAIHRLIQAILKDQLSEAETKTYLGEVVELSFEVFPTGWDTKELRELCRTLQDQVVEPIFEAAKFESHRGGILLMRIGLFLHHDGKLKDAERLERRGWNILKRTLGVEHPDTLTSMNNLALTYYNQGKLQEAVDLQEKVLEATRRTLGVEHPDTLTSMNNLALTYKHQGKLQEAMDLQEEVLEARRRTLGVEHPGTLTSMNNVSITYATFGRATDAILLMVPCVEASRRVLGQRHPDTIAREHTLEIFENEKLGHPSP